LSVFFYQPLPPLLFYESKTLHFEKEGRKEERKKERKKEREKEKEKEGKKALDLLLAISHKIRKGTKEPNANFPVVNKLEPSINQDKAEKERTRASQHMPKRMKLKSLNIWAKMLINHPASKAKQEEGKAIKKGPFGLPVTKEGPGHEGAGGGEDAPGELKGQRERGGYVGGSEDKADDKEGQGEELEAVGLFRLNDSIKPLAGRPHHGDLVPKLG